MRLAFPRQLKFVTLHSSRRSITLTRSNMPSQLPRLTLEVQPTARGTLSECEYLMRRRNGLISVGQRLLNATMYVGIVGEWVSGAVWDLQVHFECVDVGIYKKCCKLFVTLCWWLPRSCYGFHPATLFWTVSDSALRSVCVNSTNCSLWRGWLSW